MKNTWTFIITAIIAILFLGGIGIKVYLQRPLFGQLPSGAQMPRIEHSHNYTDGEFHNQIDSPLLTTDQTQVSIMLDSIINKGMTFPPHPLPSIKTDLNSLNIHDDVVIWLGHSSFYVQLNGQRLLIDPVFSANASPVPWTNIAFDGSNLYTASDMPSIDALIISHDHYDHLDYPSILALQPKVKKVIVPLGVGAHFKHWGYNMNRVQEVDWYDSLDISPTLQIIATPARHFSGRTFTKNKSLWMGFALVSSKRKLFFSGDTGYGPHFKEISLRIGSFDWAALDMGQYDSRWVNVHMTPEQAAQAAEDLRTQILMPAHAGKFSLSRHDWDDPFKRITAASEGRNYSLWTPQIGQTVHLDNREQTFSSWWVDNAKDTSQSPR